MIAPPKKTHQKKPEAGRLSRTVAVAVAAALVAAVGVGVWAVLTDAPKEEPVKEEKAKKRGGRIADAVPSAPGKRAKAQEASGKRVYTDEERLAAFREIRAREYEGPVLDMDTYVSPDPGFSNRWERFKAEQANLPFKYRSENEIAVVTGTEPGQMILETAFMPNFERDFLKSLEETIIPTEDDDEKTTQLKRDMVQAKIILKEAYDNGEDIVEILKEERAQLQKIYNLRSNLFQELKAIEKTATSSQEIDDFVSAANVMLDEYGALHIKLPYSKERYRLEKAEGLIK